MSIRQYHFRIVLLCILMAGTLAAHAQKENMETLFDIHHLLAYLVAGFLIMVFVMLFYNRVFYYREKDARRESNRLNRQLSMILDSNKTQTWTFGVDNELFIVISEMSEKKYSFFDFSQFYDRDSFQELRKTIISVSKGKEQSESVLVKGGHFNQEGNAQQTYEINVSILRQDKKNRPTMLLGIQQNITEEKEKIEKADKLALRYHTVFDSSLVDMVYYDADGYMADINDKACETFHITDREALLSKKIHINDTPTLADLDINKGDEFQFSSISDVNQVKEAIGESGVQNHKKLYYELNVSAIRDDQGQLQGVVTAGRDI